MTQVLDGIRVVDLTQALAGPYCTMLLGDMGADVIKIERPGTGDQSRGWGPPFVAGESAYYLGTNRNKKSLSLNIQHAKGKEVLHQLLAQADVFVCNIPKLASRQRAGVDAETLFALNPRLIYCSISGYGKGGPYAERPGYDLVAQGEAGLMSLTGDPDPNGKPYRFPVPMADMTIGLYSTIGILGALYARERTGQGQELDMSLLEGQSAWAMLMASSYLNAGVETPRMGNIHPNIVPYQIFQAKDKYIIVAVGTESQWVDFCKILELPHLQNDPRFCVNAERINNRVALVALLNERLSTQPAAHWLEKLRQVRIPSGPINRLSESLAHPQHQARNFIVTLEHPLAGTLKLLGNPLRFSQTPVNYRLPPPLLGEHTDSILSNLAYSEATIADMRAAKVI